MLAAQGLDRWADAIEAQLDEILTHAPHGDWTRWRQAIERLPGLGSGSVDCADGALTLVPDRPPTPEVRQRLQDALMRLRPWRKGPYRIAQVMVDTEWRSD